MSMHNKWFSLPASHHQTSYLTGLRAYAALGVLLIHSGGAGLRQFGYFANRFVDFGKQGVMVFFILSAYTLFASIAKKDAANKYSLGAYFTRRVLRICPIYFLLLVIISLSGLTFYWGQFFHVQNDWHSFLMHITFLNIFDVRYTTNTIGVEWSLQIEMFYYLLIPLLYYLLKRFNIFVVFGVCLSLVALRKVPLYFNDPQYATLAMHWFPFKYGLCYFGGIFAFYVHDRMNIKRCLANAYLTAGILGLMLLYIFHPFMNTLMFVTISTSMLLLTLSSDNPLCRWLFQNRMATYLGMISYSIYLIHYPVISLLKPHLDNRFLLFSLSLGITVFLSTFTYHFVEKPFLSLKVWRFESRKPKARMNWQQNS